MHELESSDVSECVSELQGDQVEGILAHEAARETLAQRATTEELLGGENERLSTIDELPQGQNTGDVRMLASLHRIDLSRCTFGENG